MKRLIWSIIFLFSATLFANSKIESAELEIIAPIEASVNANLKVSEDVTLAPKVTATSNASTIVPSKSTISEADIPVKLNENKKSNQAESPWLRMLFVLGMVTIMAIVSYLYLKKKKSLARSLGPVPEIKLLTQFHIGPKKSLVIIRVAGESILLGVTDNNINLIKGLSLIDDEIPANLPNKFSETLEDSNGEDFLIKGIQDVVSEKLKNMRSFQ